MQLKTLKQFVHRIFDDLAVRTRLEVEVAPADRLAEFVSAARQYDYDFTAEDVVNCLAPGADPADGYLECYEAPNGTLRVAWCDGDGEVRGVFISREVSYEHIFDTDAPVKYELTFAEALGAIGLLTMLVDDMFGDAEVRQIDAALQHADATPDEMNDIRHRVKRIYNEDGPDVLFNAARAVLDEAGRRVALELSVRVIYADRRTIKEEVVFASGLARALKVPQAEFEAMARRIHEEVAPPEA